MLLAVNMPEHEPQVGQAFSSMSVQLAYAHLAGGHFADAFEDSGQVDRLAGVGLAGLHRSAGDEDRRDVNAGGAHHHAGNDLVAVGDADDAVEAVGAQHRLDAIGDQFARGERILHADVAHGDAVVDADGVEFKWNSAGRVDRLTHFLADHIEMGVARNDLHERIADRDKRLVEIGFRFQHSSRSQQAAVGGTDHSLLDGVADGHSGDILVKE